MTLSRPHPAILLAIAVCLLTCGIAPSRGEPTDSGPDDMLNLSLEDLLDMEVTSVTKRAQPLRDAAAAVFVINGDDLDRWGVTSIPEALRYVPGLQVASIDASKWAVSARGHNGRFSNKLLVLIDGRSVYTPLFSGVYWDVQDLVLEDVERIEVIRGPGSTLWGANAVNGVINIITKHVADTQGGLVTAGAGDFEHGFGSFRYGTHWGDGGFVRLWAKGFERGDFDRPDGGSAEDDWHLYNGGFRLDQAFGSAQSLMVQGRYYDGEFSQYVVHPLLEAPYSRITKNTGTDSGAHVLATWKQTFSPTSELSITGYWDHAVRRELMFDQDDHQFNLDLQHGFGWSRQIITWGVGYRRTESNLSTFEFLHQIDDSDGDLFSAFLQDEIQLQDEELFLTVGSKFEHHDDTGLEIQPNLRLAWRPHPRHRLWSAASRAVRTPMGVENRLESLYQVVPPGTAENPGPLPLAIYAVGNPDFESEVLWAYELGYRYTSETFSADVATFYHDYSKMEAMALGEVYMRTIDSVPVMVLPTSFINDYSLANYGVEIALNWQVADWQRWSLAYALLMTDETSVAASGFFFAPPKHQLSAVLDLQLPAQLGLNLRPRYVDACEARTGDAPDGDPIKSYIDLDAGLRWSLSDRWQATVAGRNLLNASRVQYLPELWTLPAAAVRSYHLELQWTF